MKTSVDQNVICTPYRRQTSFVNSWRPLYCRGFISNTSRRRGNITEMSSQSPPSHITGSCACGKVRFTAEPRPEATVYCYCTTCRKASGAAYMPFVHFRKNDIHWDGQPEKWEKTDKATRTHCSTCGSCMSMWYHNKPEEVGILAGCIDEGIELINPVKACIFVSEKPAWAELPRDVPAFNQGYTSGRYTSD